jgi:predicted acylesterase/phospholipase RssA
VTFAISALDLDRARARGRSLLEGPPAPQKEIVRVAQDLMRGREWVEAAKLWILARSVRTLDRDAHVDTLSIAQHAQCISKERRAFSLDVAFAQAVAILEAGGLRETVDQETLGIAGGIYKRYWDAFRQPEHLQQSFEYYNRGWRAQGIADNGYTGINAAYVADVMAYLEETVAKRAGAESESADRNHRAAQEYRHAIVAHAKELDDIVSEKIRRGRWAEPADHPWWILATLAEAHLGLARDDSQSYAPAREYLSRALALPDLPDWMVETTARQLGAMARMHALTAPVSGGADSRTWQVLDALTRRVPGLRTELGGRVGLALSGGGFRASLFHIGVLACLAELDLLRHVEVLSCVSGGSILGAAYYLSLRDLLQAKRDDEITAEDYVAIVRGLEKDFLQAIQKNNFRMRMIEHPAANLAMLKNRASRTEALGLALGREIYGSAETYMDEVKIQPKDGEPGFEPTDHNWRRKNKVPLLVLNATNQADGHAWQFTPYQMGEPQTSPVDSNPRMAPRPYDPENRVHLWRAVSASACVPALFEPIRVPFGGEPVDLLDGGVHDNQGASALLSQDCTLLLVSDASGQLANDSHAGTSFAEVGLRADEIVQERLRIALYEALEARRRGSLLRGMLFLHLRLGLDGSDAKTTPYGVPEAVQRRLAAIRTDLDVFHDAEAMSLMVSGYRMARDQLPKQLPDVPMPAPAEAAFEFRKLEPKVTTHPSSRLIDLLDVSSQRMFKAWRAVPALNRVGMVLKGCAAVGAAALMYELLLSPAVIRVSSVSWSILGALVGWIAARRLKARVPGWRKELAFVAIALGGAVVAWLHAKWLDPAYLRAGRREAI